MYNKMLSEQKIRSFEIQELLDRDHLFLRDGLHTPFNHLRENLHLATSFVHNQGTIGCIQWLEYAGQAVIIDGNHLHLKDIKRGLELAIDDMGNQLYKAVLLG